MFRCRVDKRNTSVEESFPQIENESHRDASPYDTPPRRNLPVFKSLDPVDPWVKYPTTEYALLRAKGYPRRLEHLSIRLENMEMQSVRWSSHPLPVAPIRLSGSSAMALIWNTASVIPVEGRTGTSNSWTSAFMGSNRT